VIEPADENDKRRAKSDYLHWEDEDSSKWDVYFDSLDQAIDFINERGWSFVTEDWELFGMFESRIECKDHHGSVVGQLLMLRIKLWED
jgi:hypothetical protein